MTASRAVLLLAAVLAAWNVWGYDLWAPDEPYFGEGAREMVADGHWAVPHVNGVVTTDKPPLFFWLIALFSLPYHRVSSFTARLPSILAYLGSVALTVRLGRRWWGESAGALAGLILATTYLPWDKGRTAQIDALLCFLVLAALTAFETHRSGDAPGRAMGLAFWLCAGLSVLAKGPVGLCLLVGVALLALAFDGNLRAWKGFAPFSGPALFAGVVVAWMAVAMLAGGSDYSVWAAVKRHVLERAVYGLHHKQPPWYYAEVLPVGLLPWSLLVPGAVWSALRNRRQPSERLLLIWAAFVVAFFSVWTEKRDLYVLPAYPAFALMVARVVDRAASKAAASAPDGAPAPRPRWVLIPVRLTGGLFVLTGLALPFLVRRYEPALLVPSLIVSGVLALGGMLILAASAGRPLRAAAATAGVVSAFYLITVSVLYPALNPLKSVGSLAVRMKEVTNSYRAEGNRVLAYGLDNITRQLSFYSDGVYVREIFNRSELAAALSGEKQVFAVARAEQIGKLPPEVSSRIHVITSAPLAGGEVLLVSNRALPNASGGAAASVSH